MYVTIELDKARNFKFGMRAFDIVENLTGQPLKNIDFNNVTMRTLATIMYAGLVHEDKDLTIDKVMDLVDKHSNIKTASNALGRAIYLALSGKSQKEAEEIIGKLEKEEAEKVTGKLEEKNV